jgi:hypothetical protein
VLRSDGDAFAVLHFRMKIAPVEFSKHGSAELNPKEPPLKTLALSHRGVPAAKKANPGEQKWRSATLRLLYARNCHLLD